MKINVNPEKQADIDWSHQVKDRDKWRCVVCGSEFRPNAHHIVPREIRLHRWDVENGITLCVNHHKFSRAISAHQNPMSFFVWLQEHRPQQFVTAFLRNKDLIEEEEKK